MNNTIEQTEWYVRGNGQGFVIMDNNANWIAEFKRESDAEQVCDLWNGHWLTPDDWSAVADARKEVIKQLQSQLCSEQEKLKMENETVVRENIAHLIKENSTLRDAVLDLLRSAPGDGNEQYRSALMNGRKAVNL